MKKWRLLVLAVLVSASLIGLMSIQMIWIQDSVKVKEASFVRDVNRSINNVVFELEKNELQNQYHRQQQFMTQRMELLRAWDSVNNEMNRSYLDVNSGKELQVFIEESFQTQKEFQQMLMNYESNLLKRPDPNPQMIDSLLKNELERSGIHTEYEFGVFNPALGQFVLEKTGKYSEDMLTGSFVYELYPTAAVSLPLQLVVYFPNERRFLISKLWGQLSISILFILIIIGAFFTTIFLLFRQKKLSDMKNDFINNMTHEFKTPISTIALACEALRDSDLNRSEEMVTSYLLTIDEENKRLGKMAEDVLQTAVLGQGKMVLKQEEVDLHEIIEESVHTKKLQAQKKGGTIYTDLNARHTKIKADKVHLQNVVLNLLDNAIKYTTDAPEVLISTKNTNQGLLISVQDNGIGISKKNQKKIFEKLYRVSGGNIHTFKGFGLGLSYVKAIIEALGGEISLESELKNGSTFYVRIPNNLQI